MKIESIIAWELSVGMVVSAIESGARIDVDSPGGSIYLGMSIANEIGKRPDVDVWVTGACCGCAMAIGVHGVWTRDAVGLLVEPLTAVDIAMLAALGNYGLEGERIGWGYALRPESYEQQCSEQTPQLPAAIARAMPGYFDALETMR